MLTRIAAKKGGVNLQNLIMCFQFHLTPTYITLDIYVDKTGRY